MREYSAFSLIKNALNGNQDWKPAWRKPAAQSIRVHDRGNRLGASHNAMLTRATLARVTSARATLDRVTSARANAARGNAARVTRVRASSRLVSAARAMTARSSKASRAFT